MEAAIRRAELNAIAQWTENEIVHCDLKLQNVMIDKTGEVKIIDFGIAVVDKQFGLGSDYLKAPEQFSSEEEIEEAEKAEEAESKRAEAEGSESKLEIAAKWDRKRVGSHTDPFAVGASTLLVFEGDENGTLDVHNLSKPNSSSDAPLGSPGQRLKRLPNTGLIIDREIRKDQAGHVIRPRGVFAAETALTRFIDLTMTKRCTAKEALAEPFIANPVVDADAAKQLLAKVVEKTRDGSIFSPKIDGGAAQLAGDPHRSVKVRGIATRPMSYTERMASLKRELAGAGNVRSLAGIYDRLARAQVENSGPTARPKPAETTDPSAKS
jgi:serine/threonine protein kinase